MLPAACSLRPGVSTVRTPIILSLAVIVPLGVLAKLYTGWYRDWVNNSASGILYEVFWCLALFLVWPRRAAIRRIVIGVFLVTCGLEVLQLWHPSWLGAFRSTVAGRTLIGTTFAWSDFAYYAIGSGVGWLWLRWLTRCGPDAP